MIEVRNDLHGPLAVDLGALAREAPVLLSERKGALPATWIERAWKVDLPVGTAVTSGVPGEKILWSHHAPAPMSTEEAAAWWSSFPAAAAVKHVEPVGALKEGSRIFATQRALNSRFANATTAAASNAFDYVAFGSNWSAAPGQRMLADAVRSDEKRASGGARLGIIGTSLAASRSPRTHGQPFDRIDLPAETDVAALLNALLPHWRGVAVTSPFKKRVAGAVGAELASINCLYRVDGRWRSANTDVDGARVALKRLGAASVRALGGRPRYLGAAWFCAQARAQRTLWEAVA